MAYERIPKEVIEEIKYRSDIVDIVSGYVKLKRAGSNMNGLCPFHSEKTPSFTVFPSTNNFYCFGCGVGGDAISFIMKEESLSYPEAVELLGKRAGITVERTSQAEDGGVRKTRLLEMNKEAARFFHTCLLDAKTYPEPLAYLKRRGLSMPLIRHFGIGFAPEDRFLLQNHLKSKGFTEEEMLRGFLYGKTVSTKTGKPYTYDYFRNRVIFPIIDLTGNIVAFGGRVMDDSKPKYLNTSDTPAFKKSRQLFALNFAKNHCAEQLILCEGYMDVIALHGAGFENAVATLGTAITPDHARIMKRYTKSVIISYDSDAAGQNAADKAFRMLGEVGLDTKVLKVENAKDPDEYIKKFGADAFRKLLSGCRSEFEFKLDGILQNYHLGETDEKIKAADKITTLIAGFPSDVERELYISAVSAKLEIPEQMLRTDTERKRRKGVKKQSREDFTKIVTASGGYGDRVNPDYVRNPEAAAAEEAILGIMLLRQEAALSAVGGKLVEEDFRTAFNRRVFTYIRSNMRDDGTVEEGTMAESFTPEEMGRIVRMKVRRLELSDNGETVFDECIERLRGARNDKEIDSIEDIENILGNKKRRSNRGN